MTMMPDVEVSPWAYSPITDSSPSVIASRRRSNPALRHLGFAQTQVFDLRIYAVAFQRMGWIASPSARNDDAGVGVVTVQ
jgi:hypothetical protein